MRVTVLGSGSRGNATLVESGGTRILVDAGFSGRDLARRLARVDVEPDSITGLVVTHDHRDHTRGMGIFARRHGTPLYLTSPTRRACGKLLRGEERIVEYRACHAFAVGGLRIEPFVTVHDAADPVGVSVVEPESGLRVGVATDLGRPNGQIRHALAEADLLILEANHDEVLLQQAPYPWRVKARISSSHGHLSNEAAAAFATELLHPRLTTVVLAHLSGESNRPGLARDVVGTRLEEAGWQGRLEVASQDGPLEPLDLESLSRRYGPHQLSLL